MDLRSTFLRWGIPGWVVAISFIIFMTADYVASNDSKLYETVNTAMTEGELWHFIVVGILVAGAGVPLGFLIYQLYIYARWNSPFARRGFLPPFLLGRAEEMETYQALVDGLAAQAPWREVMIGHLVNPDKDHRTLRRYIRPLLSEALVNADSTGALCKYHLRQETILHSLGTSYIAYVLGYVLYLTVKWKIETTHWGWMIWAFVLTLIVATMVALADNDRAGRVTIAGRVQVSHPAELVLLVCAAGYLCLSPSLVEPLGFASVAGFAAVAIWWAYAVDTKFSLILFVAFAGIVYLRYGQINNLIVTFMNWPLYFSGVVFNGISLALLKNRSSAKAALAATELYYISLFLSKSGVDVQNILSTKEASDQ